MKDKIKVFIDGESGTTGLEIRGHLEHRQDIQLITISRENRKSKDARAKCLNEADIVSCVCRMKPPKRQLHWLKIKKL